MIPIIFALSNLPVGLGEPHHQADFLQLNNRLKSRPGMDCIWACVWAGSGHDVIGSTSLRYSLKTSEFLSKELLLVCV